MIIRRFVVLAMAVGLLTTITTPPASAADTTTDLGVTLTWGEGDLAVAGGKVFVSTGDRILATDAQGQPTGSITGLSHVADLIARPDGTRLYAALAGSGEVAEIDTTTLAITRRIALTAYPCPTSLALSGERLWVGYGCGNEWRGGVLGLDLSSAAPSPAAFGRLHNAAPKLAAAGNTLIVAVHGVSPADLIVYDISGATPVLRGKVDGFAYMTHGDARDVALTADGSQAMAAFYTNDPFNSWNTTTFDKVRQYPVSGYQGVQMSVAFSSNDARVATGRFGGTADVTVYETATGATVFSGDNPAGLSTQGGLAFSGPDVYALLLTYSTKQLHLWRVQGVAA